jgi:probable phosphoglycerate mutase
MILYIIRHGEPDYSTDSLTDNGKKQASALADRLCLHGLDEIYSSPLGRAVQTAMPVCERLGLAYTVEEWMSEDKVFEELSAADGGGARDWAFGCQNTKMVGFEGADGEWHTNPVFSSCKAAHAGYRRIAGSSDDFLARLGYRREGRVYKITDPSDKRVAAFCHHGLGTAWLSHLLNIPPHIFWSGFDIAHSSVTMLVFRNNPDGETAPQCMCLSDISHIYKEKLPLNAPVRFF